MLRRRFGLAWISKEHISSLKFDDLRVKDNVEGSNDSTLVASCRNGAEVPQYSGIQMLRIFQMLQISATTTAMSQLVSFENCWTVLISRQSSLGINLKLLISITLENSEGDYAITMSRDGKYVAGGSRLVEVFLVETGRRLWAFDIPLSDDDEIHAASFNESATRLATAGEKGIIYVGALFPRSLSSLCWIASPISSCTIQTLIFHSCGIWNLGCLWEP